MYMGNIVLRSINGQQHRIQAGPYYDGHIQLGLQLNSAGFEECADSPSYDWDGLKRGDKATVLLQYTLSGQGALRFDDLHFDIHPGQMMLVVIPHNHRYWLPSNQTWEHVYITCAGSETIRLASEIIKQHGPVFALDPKGPCISHFSQLIRMCLDQQLSSARQASQLLYGIFMDLLSVKEHLHISPDAHAIQQSIEYGRIHLHTEIGVQELANVAQMSRHHFSRVFKQHLGISPALWINQQRIQLACTLLLEGTHSMQQITDLCGFSDVNYFGKVFKRIQGMSPGQYRDSRLYG